MKGLNYFFSVVMLLSTLGLRAQGGGKQPMIVEIKPVFSGQQLALGKTYLTPKGDTVSIHRLRFYLSGFELVYADGKRYTEPNSYHLVDVEDPSSFSIPMVNAPAGKISTILFNIGVDSTASVSGALSGALDPVKGMYWAWNSGYINAKLEGTCKNSPGKKDHSFEFHIGGYLQPHYAIRPVKLAFKEACEFKKIILQSDASAWLEGLDLKKENSVVIPGTEAMQIADKYSKMFSIVNQ